MATGRVAWRRTTFGDTTKAESMEQPAPGAKHDWCSVTFVGELDKRLADRSVKQQGLVPDAG